MTDIPSFIFEFFGPYAEWKSGVVSTAFVESGSSVLIGDGFYLTAAHLVYEFNQAQDVSQRDIIVDARLLLPFGGYREAYLNAAKAYNFELTYQNAGGETKPALSADIEGRAGLTLHGSDIALVSGSGSVGQDGLGLAVFIDPNDLLTVGAGFGSNLERYYNSPQTGAGSDTGIVTGLTGYGAGFSFSNASVGGQSGGPYVFEFDSKSYVLGVQSATSLSTAYGVYIDLDFFYSINLQMSASHLGNVTDNEPANLVVGSAQNDSIVGSFRSDTLLGRGGNDSLSDGDDSVGLVWANDILIGGADDDQFFAGEGNDIIWGGEEDSDAGHTDGTDTITYVDAFSGITVTIAGTSSPVVTVRDGSAHNGTDTLHSIERIVGSDNADAIMLTALSSQIANAFDYIDLGGSNQDRIDLSELNGSVTVNLSNLQSQTVTLGSAVLNLRNVEQVIGSGHDDTITGPSGGTATTILAGGGNDTIRVAGVGHTVDGGAGEDTLELISVTGSRVDGDGHSVVGNDGSFGYSAIETVRGGSGNDRMFGGDTGHYIAGSGTSYLEGSGADTILESTTGDTYFAVSNGATVISGAGNDYIDVSGPEPVTIKFGVGSGHDMLGSYFDWPEGETRQDVIFFEGLTIDDIELVWEFTEEGYVHHYVEDPYMGHPAHDVDWHAREGHAAIRIKSTGETLYLGKIWYEYSDHFADYTAYFGDDYDVWTVDWDTRNQRSAINETADGGLHHTWYYSPDNASDFDDYSVDVNIFSFDGVNRLSIFDLFDLRTVVSQPLPAETLAAQDLLDRLDNGSSGVAAGSSGADNLNGTATGDDILAGDGNDTIDGGGGSDFIRGGGGNDIIVSGSGHDNISGGDGRDTLDYSTAGARVTVSLALTTAQNTGGAGTDTISEVEDLIGSAFNDVLTGNAKDNKIVGAAGNDTLDGGAGNDVLDGGADRDIVTYATAGAAVVVDLSLSGPQDTGGGGIDTLIGIENIVGSNYDDTLIGSDEGNNIKGGGGNDTIRGSGLNDVLEGGEGNDTLNGEAGFDVVSYSTASSGVTVSLAISTAQDTVGAGVDTIVGLERLTGSAYSDVLGGSSEVNIIAGGAGNDRITGGYGSDTLTGDAGADSFIFDSALSATGNVDKITDFTSGLDRFELAQSIFTALGGPGALSASQFHVGTAAGDAQDRIIHDPATGNIYYDADGSGAGAQMLFAQVTAGLTLASTDFSVV